MLFNAPDSLILHWLLTCRSRVIKIQVSNAEHTPGHLGVLSTKDNRKKIRKKNGQKKIRLWQRKKN